MAISGVADADIVAIAQYTGLGRKVVALELNNYSYQPRTATAVDSTGRVGTLTGGNLQGDVRVDWGDGTVTHNTGAAVNTIAHTYAVAGTYPISVSALGFSKLISRSIA